NRTAIGGFGFSVNGSNRNGTESVFGACSRPRVWACDLLNGSPNGRHRGNPAPSGRLSRHGRSLCVVKGRDLRSQSAPLEMVMRHSSIGDDLGSGLAGALIGGRVSVQSWPAACSANARLEVHSEIIGMMLVVPNIWPRIVTFVNIEVATMMEMVQPAE